MDQHRHVRRDKLLQLGLECATPFSLEFDPLREKPENLLECSDKLLTHGFLPLPHTGRLRVKRLRRG